MYANYKDTYILHVSVLSSLALLFAGASLGPEAITCTLREKETVDKVNENTRYSQNNPAWA